MHYYLPELWIKMNGPDPGEREEAARRWRENAERYAEVFAALAPSLPPEFLQAWERHGGFHDRQIRELRFLDRNKTLRLRLDLGETEGLLTLRGVSRFRLDVQSFASSLRGRLCWSYAEFSRGPDRELELAILCDFDNELQVRFAALDYRERNPDRARKKKEKRP